MLETTRLKPLGFHQASSIRMVTPKGNSEITASKQSPSAKPIHSSTLLLFLLRWERQVWGVMAIWDSWASLKPVILEPNQWLVSGKFQDILNQVKHYSNRNQLRWSVFQFIHRFQKVSISNNMEVERFTSATAHSSWARSPQIQVWATLHAGPPP